MKLLTAMIIDYRTQTVKTQKGDRIKHVFDAHETDLNGARIPVELQTFNEDIARKLQAHVKSGESIYVPYDNQSEYSGKHQFNVSSYVMHPDFVLSV